MQPAEVTTELDIDARSPGRARSIVRTVLGADRDPELAMLLASELVTNAVRHTRRRISFRVSVRSQTVRLEVTDDGDGMPTLRDSDELACGGRGLGLVSAMASDWGVRPLIPGSPAEGKTVWCETVLHAVPV